MWIFLFFIFVKLCIAICVARQVHIYLFFSHFSLFINFEIVSQERLKILFLIRTFRSSLDFLYKGLDDYVRKLFEIFNDYKINKISILHEHTFSWMIFNIRVSVIT